MMRLILITACNFISLSCLGQTNKITEDYRAFYVPQKDLPLKRKRSFSPFQWALLFYKEVLSNQVSATCDYHPSCSSFSQGCLKEHGVIKGLFLTADRLSRCSGNSAKEYMNVLFDEETHGKVLDYPSFYSFRKPPTE
jgi:putative component of membrane protein insertase Oxa1/YidC/SpoIIIJ protein YidD